METSVGDGVFEPVQKRVLLYFQDIHRKQRTVSENAWCARKGINFGEFTLYNDGRL